MEVIDEKKINEKAWNHQIINFNKKKYLELNNYNKAKYINEKKERDKIYSTFNPKLLMKDFSYPVENIKISSEFGLIRIWKINKRIFSQDIHNGLDLVNPLGTNVYAPADGIIKYANLCELVGNIIIIDHGLSIYTEYYHLNEILVPEGTFVKKGELIGKVGMTGASTGYHLHWGLRISGYPVDPCSLLKINDIFLY